VLFRYRFIDVLYRVRYLQCGTECTETPKRAFLPKTHRSSLSLGTKIRTLLHLSYMGLAPFKLSVSQKAVGSCGTRAPLSRIILFLCYKEISPQVKNCPKDPQEYHCSIRTERVKPCLLTSPGITPNCELPQVFQLLSLSIEPTVCTFAQ
jgi:hypothetical protein